jgi:hypothetical protein
MATVRFSDELKASIITNARELFKDRLVKAQEDHPDTWGQTVYDLVFKHHKSAMVSLPSSYFGTLDSLSIAGFTGTDWHGNNHSINLQLTSRLPIPNTVDADIHGLAKEGRTYGGWQLNADDPRWDTFKVEYKKYSSGVDKIQNERTAFQEGVTKIMNTYTTLAPALKAWPPLWDLVPHDKQQRHKEIVERKKKEVVVEGVDLASMTAASTLAKFTN